MSWIDVQCRLTKVAMEFQVSPGVTEPDVGDEEAQCEAFYGANSGALFAFIALSSTWLWVMADSGFLDTKPGHVERR